MGRRQSPPQQTAQACTHSVKVCKLSCHLTASFVRKCFSPPQTFTTEIECNLHLCLLFLALVQILGLNGGSLSLETPEQHQQKRSACLREAEVDAEVLTTHAKRGESIVSLWITTHRACKRPHSMQKRAHVFPVVCISTGGKKVVIHRC